MVTKIEVKQNINPDKIILKPWVVERVEYETHGKNKKKLKKAKEISRIKIKAFSFRDEAMAYRRDLP